MTNFVTRTTLTLAAAACLTSAAHAADVTITLTGVEARGGVLYVSLQDEASFMQPESDYGAAIENPEAGSLVITLSDVAPGDYALSVLHDADSDGDMKRAANGYPLEGWAMSNAATLRGFPTFEVVDFTVTEDGTTITEPVFYPES